MTLRNLSTALLAACCLTYGSLSMATSISNTNGAIPQALFKEAMAELLGSRGKVKAPEKAFEKFEALAHQGWKTAQHMLGSLYEKGEGTERSQIKAYLWYSLAARDNFSLAERKRDDLRAVLKPVELEQAEQLLSEWRQ